MAAAATEEIEARRCIKRARFFVEEEVEVFEPEEQEASGDGDRSSRLPGGYGAVKEILDRPGEGHRRATDDTAIYLVKAAEESAVAQVCEPSEVIAAGMHLLHERSLCVDKSAVLEDAMGLVDAAVGVYDGLEHSLKYDAVDGS